MNLPRILIGNRQLPLVLSLLLGLLAAPAMATVTLSSSGTSGIGSPVSFGADLTISGNTLTIHLTNASPGTSLGPNDTLGSFYFDIVNNANVRPTLTYVSAAGDVWLTDQNNPDTLQTANANLMAVVAGDNTWQFKPMNAALNPFYGFGIGTVGNNGLSPNNFMGSIVDGFDYSIYKGDVITANLDGKLLVKDQATFTFSGLSGFTEADIVHSGAFGLGTAPDSLILAVPEPGTGLLFGLGLFGVLGSVRRIRRKE